VKIGIRPYLLLLLVALAGPAAASDPAGFAIWRSNELNSRDNALVKGVGADHSSRETLADFGDHRFRMLYRDADGAPEQHDTIIDVVGCASL
jgi:hypothetical protein